RAKAKTEQDRVAEGKEKTGVELNGIKAINPANGEEIPVWVADYELGWYGTGAIMAVPAHEERDFAFAKKFDLPVRCVIDPERYHFDDFVSFVAFRGLDNGTREVTREEVFRLLDRLRRGEFCYPGEGTLVSSGDFSRVESEKAKWEIMKFVGGKKITKYKLRDWVFSRQRYWGEPIPIVHCEKCGIVPVPEEELPVKLPEVKAYAPTGTGESPLADIPDWVNTKCPKCGGKAKRETNTMPQWAGSSWYYIAYTIRNTQGNPSTSSGNKGEKYEFRNSKLLNEWLPVDMYVGGAEHATRHLIYARFWHKFLFDIKVVSTEEPFQRLQHVGLIGGADGRKMSKRYGNVINPDDVVATFGADTLRLYEMFMGPFDANIPWSEEGILGPRRFLEKISRFFQEDLEIGTKDKGQRTKNLGDEKNLERLLHKTIKKVTEDIQGFRFNTAISALMICFNEMEKQGSPSTSSGTKQTFLKLLAPFAPHLSEELWREVLGHKTSIHLEAWPEWDPTKIEDEAFQLVVQVNGKTRATILAEKGISEKDAEKAAREDERVARHLEGRKAKKVVFVRDRLINFVTEQ
ncbi:MAG: class I tRNA ligase family protein, partial [bacterium]|nr:class I tRNA ligase family protein [bacterium]